MHPTDVRACGRRLGVDLKGLEEVQLLALDADSTLAEEKVILGELRAHLRDEENRIGELRVTELHEGRFRPLSAFELERAPQAVKALGRYLRQAVGPRQPSKGDAGAMEVPAIVDGVVG